MIQITDHKIDAGSFDGNFSFKESPNISGKFSNGLPDTIVIHYTAGASYGSSVSWLCNPKAKASAHLVVGRGGEVVQLVPFDTIAWHAGTSAWKGRKSLSNFSIGIEIANAGILEKRVSGYYTYYGTRIEDENVLLATHKNRDTEKAWECYTAKQLEVVEALCLALKSSYNITEIVGHDDIAPSRKTDPGPAFPMQTFKNKILYGRMDDAETGVEDGNVDESVITRGIVVVDKLNIRNAPGITAPTIAEPLRKATKLDILKIESEWAKVRVVTEGWVSKKYINYFE